MGNSNSTRNNPNLDKAENSVFIEIKGNSFHPGDLVTGAILMNFKSPIEVTHIVVESSGVDQASFSSQVGSGDNKRTVNRYSRNPFFSNEIKVASEGTMSGQYSFPFSFKLPTGIPGSYEYASASGDANIVYPVKCTIHVPGTFNRKIEEKAYVHVIQSPRESKALHDMTTSEVNMGCCCCYCRYCPSNGTVQIETTSERNVYNTGESINLNINIKNESVRDIKKLFIGLVSVSKLRAEGHSRHIPDLVSKIEGPGLRAKQALEGLTVALPIPSDIQQSSSAYHARHIYKIHVISVIDPLLPRSQVKLQFYQLTGFQL